MFEARVNRGFARVYVEVKPAAGWPPYRDLSAADGRLGRAGGTLLYAALTAAFAGRDDLHINIVDGTWTTHFSYFVYIDTPGFRHAVEADGPYDDVFVKARQVVISTLAAPSTFFLLGGESSKTPPPLLVFTESTL